MYDDVSGGWDVCKVVGVGVGVGLKGWRYVYGWIGLDGGGCMYVVAMEEDVGRGLDGLATVC